ncbi:MAG TPA: hypothetical protein VGL39_09430 [Jatrophihabitantaceae bacterium]|jgi:hypothetical protein
MTTTTMIDTDTARLLAGQLIEFLETGEVADGLFAPDVFCDFTPPEWRLQAQGLGGTVAIRKAGHPSKGRVPQARLDVTERGFVLEVEEIWDGDDGEWYCRELIRADVTDSSVSAISVYCTGDWSPAQRARHSAEVTLLRP